MKKPVIILGSGGHAKVLINILKLCDIKIFGITDPETPKSYGLYEDITYLGDDNSISEYSPDKLLLVNGLGSAGKCDKRKLLFDKFKNHGYSFASLIHPSAIIAPDVKLSEGVQVMAGAIIQPGSIIGKNTIINTKVSVDHDCQIGSHVHLAPGVTLSGNVKVGDETHIGTGANIIQNINIGRNSLVGAGSLVLNNIPENSKAFGVPVKLNNNIKENLR